MMRPEEVTFDAEENVLEERSNPSRSSARSCGSRLRWTVAGCGPLQRAIAPAAGSGDATQISFPAHACWVMV